MKVILIAIIIRALEAIHIGLVRVLDELEVGGCVYTIHCHDRPEYFEESGRLGETFSHSGCCQRPSPYAGVKNLQGII